jgi:hypothetical protein
MANIDIYEMIEDILAQPPYNLPKDDGRKQVLVYDLVGLIPPHVFAKALREVAARTGFRLDDDVQDIEEDIEEDWSIYDDEMDGDWDSGMASAGFGTDEDYGYYGE